MAIMVSPTITVNISSMAIPNKFQISLTVSSAIALSGLTAFLLVFTCSLVFLYYYGIGKRYTLDARTSLVLFFLTALLATVAGVCGTSSAMDVYRVYVFGIISSVGLLFVGAGAYLFFDHSAGIGNVAKNDIGHNHGSMGIVIWLVTLPLIAIEFVILLGNLKERQSHFYTADYVVALLQKLAQASIYYFSLRHRYSSEFCPTATQWYFQILSLMNFILWEDSIMTSHVDDKYSKSLYGDGFSILKTTYNALLIDYRLMCCLIFLEHSIEVRDEDQLSSRPSQAVSSTSIAQTVSENRSLTESAPVVRLPDSVSSQVAHYTGAGYILGLVCFAIQVLNGIQYFGFVGAWSNLMPIVADLMVFGLGIAFLRVNNLDSDIGKWRESDSRAIDAMVGIMGGVGFTFMVIRSILTSSMISYYKGTTLETYLALTALKNCSRAIGVLFQLYLFMRVSIRVCSKKANKGKTINHFLIPSLLLVQIAVFVTAIVDQYNGKVEKILAKSDLDSSVRFFLEAGAPIYLGFCLHMFLHFLIVRKRMITTKVRVSYLLEETSVMEEGYAANFYQGTEARNRRAFTPIANALTEPLLANDDKQDEES